MRHRSLFTTALALIVVSLLSSQTHANWWNNSEKVTGLGKSVDQVRQVDEFSEVELATQGMLYVEIGDEFKVVIRGQENLQEHVLVRVRRGTLLIYTEDDLDLRPTRALEYHVTLPHLSEIILSSSGDAEIGDITVDKFGITCESSGDLEIGNLVCTDLRARLESSGDVYIQSWEGKVLSARLSSSGDLEINRGTVDEQEIDIESSGDYHAKNLDSRSTIVHSESSGDAHIRVRETLYARTHSSGDILYVGHPEVDARSSSSGDIVRTGR